MPICLTLFLSSKAISVGVISDIAMVAVTKRSILTKSFSSERYSTCSDLLSHAQNEGDKMLLLKFEIFLRLFLGLVILTSKSTPIIITLFITLSNFLKEFREFNNK